MTWTKLALLAVTLGLTLLPPLTLLDQQAAYWCQAVLCVAWALALWRVSCAAATLPALGTEHQPGNPLRRTLAARSKDHLQRGAPAQCLPRHVPGS
ncbi:MAG TPA: hypothetical protein EYG11_21330 [Candidatus Latescibacteria bacterium]|nr:hypothetical protein [Candidatus Handelsmanbacteria bacterium]HIL11242.1 hypothetical protein [Candidatus Latescibacterota bacterium]